MPTTPTTFIFDLDGVLCDYDIDHRVARMAAMTGLEPDDIRARLWGSGFESAADAGQWADGEAYLAAFVHRLGRPLTREQWIEARKASMTPFPHMLELVARLDTAGEVALLTNNVPLLADTLDEIFPEVPRLFGDRVFFSCRMRLAKPDPEIYRQVCRQLGRQPAEAVFVDDKAANAEGASRAGLTGIAFAGREALIDTLARMGVRA